MIGRRELYAPTQPGGSLVAGCDTGAFYDEVFVSQPDGGVEPRLHYRALVDQLMRLDAADLRRASASGAAGNFANKPWGYVTKAEIPAEQTISMGTTGFGTGTQEHEFVALYGAGTVHLKVKRRPF